MIDDKKSVLSQGSFAVLFFGGHANLTCPVEEIYCKITEK